MSYLTTFGDNLQTPYDAAVVIPTVLRPTLRRAIESVFAQNLPGRIHVLVGMDVPGRAWPSFADRPENVTVQTFWPGYSTSTRHGGTTPTGDGGALRTILTYLANSAHVAYLDDDNWWAPHHLSTLKAAIAGVDWAFSQRWFVHPETSLPVAIDEWESCGPHRGIRAWPPTGFVDTSCLMIDKTLCRSVPQCWTFPFLENDPMSADCTVSSFLTEMHTWRGTGEATAYYAMRETDPMHAQRTIWCGQNYVEAEMIDSDYAAAFTARVAAYRQRKAEQEAGTRAAQDAALSDAAAYMGALDLNVGRIGMATIDAA